MRVVKKPKTKSGARTCHGTLDADSRALKEIRARVGEALNYLKPGALDDDFDFEGFHRRWLNGYIEDSLLLKSDPRLVDWEETGGWSAPKGARVTIDSVEDEELDAFQMFRTRTVNYRIEEPNGESANRVAQFTKPNGHNLYDLVALRAHLEAALGEDILLHRDKVVLAFQAELENKSLDERLVLSAKDRLPSIPQPYLKRAFWGLCDHLDSMAIIEEILEPLGSEAALLIRAIHNRVNFGFGLVIDIREGVLEEQHLADALRGKAIASASKKGSQIVAARSRAHADAWKLNFGRWLQSIAQERMARIGTHGLSRENLAKLAEEEWPQGGFAGSPGMPRQIAIPSRQTLLNALKELEKLKIINRVSPPRGRRAAVFTAAERPA